MTETDEKSDVVKFLLEQISGTWDDAYPTVLSFNDPHKTVVADVNGDLRMLSQTLLYAREIEPADVRAAVEEHGRPAILLFSRVSHRFQQEDFEDLHPDDPT